ncbi:MAG: hypothetical protein HY983_00945 [Candidatus Magasanikbacteria bacterium]|nr:hypothetical protein [Candidatus Magasanikbacteria bacterium]
MLVKPSDIVKITLVPFLIFLLNEVLYSFWPGLSFDWQLDIYLHIVGGMSVAAAGIVALRVAERGGWVKINRVFAAFFLVVALVMAAAVTWEFYEFLHDYFYGTHFQPNNADTMKDLFMGTVGGILWYLGHYIRTRRVL